MTTLLPPSLLSTPIPGEIKKKRVLLVDTCAHKRELRAEIMRKLGIDVDCAADINEALSWWQPDLYNLVLIDAQNYVGQRDDFCEVVRNATPPQLLVFLVGKPDYLADVASSNGESSFPTNNDQVEGVRAALFAKSSDHPQRWGILEASRRIFAIRSASIARTHAMRALPGPPRDAEGRPSKRIASSINLDDLLKGELR